MFSEDINFNWVIWCCYTELMRHCFCEWLYNLIIRSSRFEPVRDKWKSSACPFLINTAVGPLNKAVNLNCCRGLGQYILHYNSQKWQWSICTNFRKVKIRRDLCNLCHMKIIQLTYDVSQLGMNNDWFLKNIICTTTWVDCVKKRPSHWGPIFRELNILQHMLCQFWPVLWASCCCQDEASGHTAGGSASNRQQ